MSVSRLSAGAMILEIIEVAGSRQVRAVDERDGLEVSFVAAVTASQTDIERLAVSKLIYARSRRSDRLPGDGVESGRSGTNGMVV